jgi:hypothetical protein
MAATGLCWTDAGDPTSAGAGKRSGFTAKWKALSGPAFKCTTATTNAEAADNEACIAGEAPKNDIEPKRERS